MTARSAPPVKNPASGKTKPKGNVRLARRSRRFMSESARIENEVIPAFVRPVFGLVIAMTSAFLIWASMAELAEVTRAPGEIIPSGQIKVVQHLEGGVISAIHVTERKEVKKGDILLSVSSDQLNFDLRQLQTRLVSQQLRASRLDAYTALWDEADMPRWEPEFDVFAQDYPELVSDQKKTYQNQVASRKSTLEVLLSQVKQRERRLEQLQKSLESSREQQKLAQEVLAMNEELARKKLIKRTTLFESKKEAASVQGEIAQINKEINLADQQLEEAQNRYTDTSNQLLRDALAELDKLRASISETRETIAGLEARLETNLVRAPASGLIFNLKVHTIGQVIQPGALLMQVVPGDVALEAEVRIHPKDVGNLSVGQKVNIKVSSYEYARFGAASGTLNRISAFSEVDESGVSNFRGWVTLEKAYIGQEPGRYPIQPGMAVDAEIVTGHKTLISYLSKPVIDAFSRGFSER